MGFEIVSVVLLISSTVRFAFWKRWAWSSLPTDFNVLTRLFNGIYLPDHKHQFCNNVKKFWLYEKRFGAKCQKFIFLPKISRIAYFTSCSRIHGLFNARN